MNLEGIKKRLLIFGQTPTGNRTIYQINILAHDALELVTEVERMQTHTKLIMKEPICDVCFTRSWQPCPPDTLNAVEDNTGGWMVCGYCRLVAHAEYLQAKVRVSNVVIKDHWEILRQLVSACDTVSIFIDTNCSNRIDEEYRLLVIEPFEKALARAKGEE